MSSNDKVNAALGPFNVRDNVRIRDNVLHWTILEIDGDEAVLASGQSGVRRREKLSALQPWGSRVRG